MAALTFDLQTQSKQGKSRAGKITTDHGVIQTPIFMPVGTIGSVKAVTQQQLKADIKAPIILANTYHLYLRPGLEVLEAAGGLHKFMGWDICAQPGLEARGSPSGAGSGFAPRQL